MDALRRFSGVLLIGAVFVLSAKTAFALTPNDPFFLDQWYLSRIAAPAAWDTVTGNGKVVVAVLDTAIDLDHPDLSGNLWKNTREIPGNGVDDDGNGYADDVNGWDFVEDDNDPSPELAPGEGVARDLSLSHGTFIAGIIGAETDNNLGYSGIVWDAQVMPLRILDAEGGGSENAAAEAINYAVRNGARVINLSFAGDAAGTTFRNAVRRAYESGVVVVAALGNDGRNVNEEPVYPACLRGEEDDWVIGVSATGENDEETFFTNFGNSCADLSAPGESIYGLTYSDGADALFGSQVAWSGTSAASPMVAGAAALLLAHYPDLTPSEVRAAIKLSVDPIIETLSGRGALGVGRLNIMHALQIAASFSEGGPAPVIEDKEESVDDYEEGESFQSYSQFSYVALGANKGQQPYVKLYKADGTPYTQFLAYAPSFLGGISVVVEDLDNDYKPEVITGTGDGGGPHVRVFNAVGAVMHEFFAYDAASRHGVEIATGDVDADGELDIVTAVGAGVSNDIIVWSQSGEEKLRFPVTDFALNTPLAVAVGDVDEDWESEIIVVAQSGAPRVSIYNHDGSPLVSFLAYAPNMGVGMSVAVADFDDDDRDEIVVSPLAGAPGHIRILNKIGAVWGEFFVTPQSATSGARVSAADIDIDGENDIVVIPAGAKGEVTVYSSTGDLLSIVGSGLVPEGGATLGAW